MCRMSAPSLPLPASELPDGIRRFGDPKAPGPARMMAAKGLVPVKGGDLLTLLAQLAADPEAGIADAAKDTLLGLPAGVLHAACAADLHVAVLDAVAGYFKDDQEVLERVVLNRGAGDDTVERIALTCSERVSEAIAVNQQRILAAPKIIEALYKNANTRMSTADRLIELCARSGVVLEGIPSFQDHVEAIQGELIMEPEGDEPLPEDVAFREVLAEDEASSDVVEDETEEEKKKKEEQEYNKLPLRQKIDRMKKAQKIRLALIGNAVARSILVRDPVKSIARAAIGSPKMTAGEAAGIAQSKEVSEDVLRFIAGKKKWLSTYEVKKSLVFNNKTPFGLSLKFLSHMRQNDLKAITRSRNIAGPLKQAASQRLAKKKKN
jgi:hypothetical protein